MFRDVIFTVKSFYFYDYSNWISLILPTYDEYTPGIVRFRLLGYEKKKQYIYISQYSIAFLRLVVRLHTTYILTARTYTIK